MERRILILSGLALAGLAGCMSAQNTLDAVEESLSGRSQSVYTEAYIEYAGPSARWAGPATLLLHVSASDAAGNAEVEVVPEIFDSPRVTGTRRDLASESGEEDTGYGHSSPSSSGLTSAQAREQLSYLAAALQDDELPFSGCMYPVRVRLVRNDGALLDKRGCRGQTQWTRTASQAVDFFLTRMR